MFQRVQTEETLACYKLHNKRYDSMMPYPERLIRSLYEDCTSADQFHNVNVVVEHISQLFELNLYALKVSMMTEWLPPIEQYQQEDYYPQHGFDHNESSQ